MNTYSCLAYTYNSKVRLSVLDLDLDMNYEYGSQGPDHDFWAMKGNVFPAPSNLNQKLRTF